MKISSANYLVGATNTSNFPNLNLPEILLCGRSNVGKSTFINTLFNAKIAKTSSTPGKTQVLNWFVINEEFCLVDAPGYGYAKVSKKQREEFGAMIEDYLTNRKELKMVLMLLDYRHPPTEDDIIMYEYLKYHNLKVKFILTKEDKLKRNDLIKNLNIIMKALNHYQKEDYISFSSVSKINKEQVFKLFESII